MSKILILYPFHSNLKFFIYFITVSHDSKNHPCFTNGTSKPMGIKAMYTQPGWYFCHVPQCSDSPPLPKGGSPGDGTHDIGWRPPIFQKIVFQFVLITACAEVVFYRGAGENQSTFLKLKTVLYLVILILTSMWEHPFSACCSSS